MTEGRWWMALVTFERGDVAQDLLPDWAQGAAGWMVALGPDEDSARHLLIRDVEDCGVRVMEIGDQREVFGEDEIEALDEHLALNFRNIEPGKRTVWGTLHCYEGGEED